jgi:aminopeptidase N
MSMRVFTSEANWTAISNENLLKKLPVHSSEAKAVINKEQLMPSLNRLKIEEQGNLFIFDTCPPISTYIYALAVGPYVAIPNLSDYRVPMKIYCRKTKVALAEPEERFRTI